MAEIERKAFQDLATEVKQKSDEAAAIIESLKSKKSNSEAGLSFLQLKNVLVSSATILNSYKCGFYEFDGTKFRWSIRGTQMNGLQLI